MRLALDASVPDTGPGRNQARRIHSAAWPTTRAIRLARWSTRNRSLLSNSKRRSSKHPVESRTPAQRRRSRHVVPCETRDRSQRRSNAVERVRWDHVYRNPGVVHRDTPLTPSTCPFTNRSLCGPRTAAPGVRPLRVKGLGNRKHPWPAARIRAPVPAWRLRLTRGKSKGSVPRRRPSPSNDVRKLSVPNFTHRLLRSRRLPTIL